MILNGNETKNIIVTKNERKESFELKCLKLFRINKNEIKSIKLKMIDADGDWNNITKPDDIINILTDYDDEPWDLKFKITIKKIAKKVERKDDDIKIESQSSVNNSLSKPEPLQASNEELEIPKYLQPCIVMPGKIELKWNTHKPNNDQNIVYYIKENTILKEYPYIYKGQANFCSIKDKIQLGKKYHFTVYAKNESNGNATPNSKELIVDTPSKSSSKNMSFFILIKYENSLQTKTFKFSYLFINSIIINIHNIIIIIITDVILINI